MRERLAILYEDDPMASHTFTARFSRYSRGKDGNILACIDHIKYEGKFSADHAWIHRSKAMKCLCLEDGDIVKFEAQITRYRRDVQYYGGEEGELDYGLCRVRNMQIIERAKG